MGRRDTKKPPEQGKEEPVPAGGGMARGRSQWAAGCVVKNSSRSMLASRSFSGRVVT